MSRTHTFGIVGGYGSTGSAVAAELLKSTGGEILLGGRDRAKATSLASKLGARVSAAQLDVFDARSLDEFCTRCSIIINCAGPVHNLQDRVAQAAFRAQSHYVDVAGMTFVKEGMLPRAKEIADAGLCFVVSAGWMPGLSELVPCYAYAMGRSRMDSLHSLNIYFGDSGEWSHNALRDAFWLIRRAGVAAPGYFHNGEWTKTKWSLATSTADLGEPIGTRRFGLFSIPELDEIARRVKDCDVYVNSYVPDFQTTVAAILIALFPLPESLGLRILRYMYRRVRLPVDGFAAAQVLGWSQGHKCSFTAQIVYRDRHDYWINGLVPALVARMISEGSSVRRGVHFLAQAVEPIQFMAELKKAGVEQSESFNPGE